MERLLTSRGHKVVEMLVGKSASRILPAFFTDGVGAPVTCFESVNFVTAAMGKHPDAIRSVLFNAVMTPKFLPSISMIRRRIRESGADVAVNFYELLGSIAYGLSGRGIPMVCIGHQFLFLHEDMHLPQAGYEGAIGLNLFSKAIARNASKILALSFREMPPSVKHRITVVPPLLRPEVLEYRKSPDFQCGDYILGYMLNAGFSEEVMTWHQVHPDVPLRFFWDNAAEAPVKKIDESLSFYYLNDKEFLRQMAGCRAYASTAGFESVCEAMYLGKPLMVVPSHIEQRCNAWDACLHDAAVSAEKFDLDILLDFSRNRFRCDEAFPGWALSAAEVIDRELESLS